ncbi:hypothetical protein [Massilia antarctica]|nr:hypothetical protein BN2497_2021 [Janthinobacterium sp. CG23_2]CUU27408.1 hypothetical protein BN3177_2021 [Janthinobacterium sp. CG23_2]
MEWAGYTGSIAGLMMLLLTFDRPGWRWQAGGAALVLTGIVLIYRSRHLRRRDDDGFDGGEGFDVDDGVVDAFSDD